MSSGDPIFIYVESLCTGRDALFASGAAKQYRIAGSKYGPAKGRRSTHESQSPKKRIVLGRLVSAYLRTRSSGLPPTAPGLLANPSKSFGGARVHAMRTSPDPLPCVRFEPGVYMERGCRGPPGQARPRRWPSAKYEEGAGRSMHVVTGDDLPPRHHAALHLPGMPPRDNEMRRSGSGIRPYIHRQSRQRDYLDSDSSAKVNELRQSRSSLALVMPGNQSTATVGMMVYLCAKSTDHSMPLPSLAALGGSPKPGHLSWWIPIAGWKGATCTLRWCGEGEQDPRDGAEDEIQEKAWYAETAEKRRGEAVAAYHEIDGRRTSIDILETRGRGRALHPARRTRGSAAMASFAGGRGQAIRRVTRWQDREASTPGNQMTDAGRRGSSSLHAGTVAGVSAQTMQEELRGSLLDTGGKEMWTGERGRKVKLAGEEMGECRMGRKKDQGDRRAKTEKSANLLILCQWAL
ncbi:hypothetical protein DFH07DRAFT_766759 [Mycena maculata]|uniref:Uncharacterized protein n=1 Tax=Mycena maculata TaxID=230809 RepID=A0AAD7NVC4_9AGAR|nr:hypothetical protein DFH07DRAFT_766759 [Mycena maculata]